MPELVTTGSSIGPIVFACGLLWLELAVGRRLLRIFGVGSVGTSTERGVMAAGLGAGLLQYIAFTLGALKVLSVPTLRYTTGAVALLFAWDLWAVAVALWRARSRVTWKWTTVAWVLALSPTIVASALLALVPTIDSDGLGYHLTVPKRWIGLGSLAYLPTYPYSNAPMGLEMLFALAMAFAGDAAAKCVHFTLGSLAAVGLYCAGKRLGNPLVGALAAALYLAGPFAVTMVLGSALVEGAAALAIVAASLAWILWYQEKATGSAFVAFLLAGFAVTFKIPSLLFPVGLFALTCVALADPARAPGPSLRRWTNAVVYALRFVPFTVAPVLFWFGRSALVTGNPFFPLFARWIPSRDFSPDFSMKFDQFNRYLTWGNVVGRNLSIEQRAHVLQVVAALLVLVGLLVTTRLRTWMGRGTALVVTGTALLQVLSAGIYLRYAIPLAAGLSLPIVASLRGFVTRRPVPEVALALTLLGSLAQVRRAAAGLQVDLRPVARTALGFEDRHAFLEQTMSLYPLYERIDGQLPQDAGVMLATYCGAFYIDRRTFCSETVQNSLRYDSWDVFVADLQRLRINYVIAPTVFATGGPAPPFDRGNTSTITREAKYAMLRPLLESHAKLIQSANDEGLYEIDSSLLGDSPPGGSGSSPSLRMGQNTAIPAAMAASSSAIGSRSDSAANVRDRHE
ncbi:MAG TPA: hypothetical protein VK841_01705 [Polyangiaceae bacterium]|jgi:hypothetical protein|nr:hypothetical protein [Polyangiaceae bacterium]